MFVLLAPRGGPQTYGWVEVARRLRFPPLRVSHTSDWPGCEELPGVGTSTVEVGQGRGQRLSPREEEGSGARALTDGSHTDRRTRRLC